MKLINICSLPKCLFRKFNVAILVIGFFCACSSVNADEGQYLYYPQERDLAVYLEKMPWSLYHAYTVPNLGSFWVDNAKDCVKDTIKQGKIWEQYIIDVLAKYLKKGDKVVDIGAHMGTISMAMSNLVGEDGKVYSFEGERQFFRELIYNTKISQRKNIIPHLCWISDEDKDIAATWFYGSEYSPVHSVDDSAWTLHVHQLDTFDLKNISLMKIDVECTEDKVLAGAKKTIMSSRPILIIEIMGGFGGANATDQTKARIAHTTSLLNDMNYTVSLIYIDDYLAIPNEKL